MSIIKSDNPSGSWANLKESENAALAGMWKIRQEWLDAQVAETNTWYDQLGSMGSEFRQAFQTAACSETIDTIKPELSRNTRAVMNAHHIYDGFMNNVLVGEACLNDENPFALFSSLNHERTHLAIQYRNVAATHATPWNSWARVMLCPRDAMIINVLMERQAFAVQRVFEDFARGINTGEIGPDNMPTPAELQASLQAYARNIGQQAKWDNDAAFVRHYRNQAQGFYSEKHADYLKSADITYARLGIEDLRAINDFLGLNTFGNTDAELMALLDQSFEGYQLEIVNEQNADLGVPSYKKLPTMTKAMQNRGMNAGDFIRQGLGKFAATMPSRRGRPDDLPVEMTIPQTRPSADQVPEFA